VTLIFCMIVVLGSERRVGVTVVSWGFVLDLVEMDVGIWDVEG